MNKSIYERISILRDKYQGSENFKQKQEILLEFMAKAFYNDDTIPTRTYFYFPYYDNPLPIEEITSIILQIFNDLDFNNAVFLGSGLVKGDQICLRFRLT